jgi:hypothetical protein
VVRRAVLVALTLWVGRWALRELASLAASHLPLPPARPRTEREPGRMPGPFDL